MFRIQQFIFIGLSLFLAAPLSADSLSLTREKRDQLKKETVYAIDLIQRYHYKQKRFTDIDSKEFLLNYMEDLDGSRLFLNQEDVDFVLNRFEDSLKPTYLFVGDLYPAFEIFEIYQKRFSNRLDWIEERLQEPFELESEDTYLTDRSEADWPASEEEADKLWEKRLTNEIILELLEDESREGAIEKVTKRYDRMRKYLEEIEIHNIQETFLTSLAQLYDPHSNFFSWDSAQEFDIQISNSLVGIGAQLRDVDSYCVIERLLPGGPAEMSGQLHPGDKIIEVGQAGSDPVDVVGMKLRKIVQMIRGEPGTTVNLTVEPANSAKRKKISLVREKIELTANLASARLYTLPQDNTRDLKVGVIDLPSFYGDGQFDEDNISTSKDVEELINKLKDQNVDGIVLDLRNNGGGRLDEAVKLTGLFISKGPVVMKRNFNGSVEEDWDRNPKVSWEGPLAVLVSRSSASASEIVAGALQNHNRAVVMGDEATHGKGTVQAPIDLKTAMQKSPFGADAEVGTIKITVQQFFLPNGSSTQNKGVHSDIVIPSANMFLLEGEADLEHALEWDKIDPVDFQLPEFGEEGFSFVSNDLITTLVAKSNQRRESLKEFDFLKENIAWYKERHERDTVSLNLEKRHKEKDEVEEMRDFFEKRRNELNDKLKFESEKVDLEMTKKKEESHQEKLASTPLPNGEPRANQFYQKVFYYQPDPDDEIHEIWVEYFDYDKAMDFADELAELLTDRLSTEITEDEMTVILREFKNLDRASEFDVFTSFENILGEDKVQRDELSEAFPAFFTKLVDIDPDVIRDTSKLDVAKRESLRVIADWVENESPLAKTKLAAKSEKKLSADPDSKEPATADSQ